MTKSGLHFVPQPDMTPEDYKAWRFVERDFMNHGIHFLTKQGYKPMPMPNNTPPKRINRFDDECYYTDDSGVMRPTTLSGESKKTAIEFGKLAVEYHNNQILKKGGKEEVMLEFVRPLKMNTQVVAGFNYYITLEAKDVGAPSDQSRIYQTLVFAGITVTKVRSFSLKSTGSEKCCAKEEEKKQVEGILIEGMSTNLRRFEI